MIGLLAYPAFVEWMWPVEDEAVIWTAAYGVFVVLVLGCALVVWRSPQPAATPVNMPEPPKEPLPTAPPVPAELAQTAISPGAPAAVRGRRGLRMPAPSKPEL